MISASSHSVLVKCASAALLVAAGLSLAACETTGAGVAGPAARAQPAPVAAAPAASTGPMTHRKAALYCWMSTEHGHADLPIDKRADIVDRCIKQKMDGD